MSRVAQLPPADLLAQVAKRLRADGHDYESGAPVVGMSREWARQLLEGELRGNVTRGTRRKLEAYLARGAGAVGESTPPYATPATFVEHVLFTAGRIAELANQIQAAAITQQRVSYDLGARAKSELGGAPSEAIVPASTPKAPKGRRTKGLNRKPA